MIDQIYSAVELALSRRRQMSVGLVTAYDPNTYTVKVTIQPENLETGWIPLLSPWVGNGWGLFAAPSIGDAVSLHFDRGYISAAVAGDRFYSVEDRPLPVPSGEFWLVHKTGAAVKLKNDGSVELTANTDLKVTVGGKLTATVTGDMTATVGGALSATSTGNALVKAPQVTLDAATVALTGNLTVNGTVVAQGSVTSITDLLVGVKSYKTHVHSGGTLTGGLTGVPQ